MKSSLEIKEERREYCISEHNFVNYSKWQDEERNIHKLHRNYPTIKSLSL